MLSKLAIVAIFTNLYKINTPPQNGEYSPFGVGISFERRKDVALRIKKQKNRLPLDKFEEEAVNVPSAIKL